MKRPRIGIFWVVGRRIIAFSESVERVRAAGGFKDSRFSHHQMWMAVVQKRRELVGREYWERPRGRVLYSVSDDQYRIFIPAKLGQQRRLIARIVSRFELPAKKVQVCLDEHYEPPRDTPDEG